MCRCLSVVRAWTARHGLQAEVPQQALRKVQHLAKEAPKEQPGAQAKGAGAGAKGAGAKGAASTAASQPRTLPSIAQVAYITLVQFDTIPKYMKGRATYEVINAAVDELNSALTEKYRFLGGRMADLPNPRAKKRHQALRAQESKVRNAPSPNAPCSMIHSQDTKGVHFVTAEELRECSHLKSETGRRSLLTILRHFGLVREVRGPGSIVRFAVVRG